MVGAACKELRNKTLFCLQNLPGVSVKASLGDVAENHYALVFISPAQDSPLPLYHIRRPPGHVQVVDRLQLHLYVCTNPELEGGPDQDPDLPFVEISKQLHFSTFRVITMDNGDLLFRDSRVRQSAFQFSVYAEILSFRGGIIAKNELRTVWMLII